MSPDTTRVVVYLLIVCVFALALFMVGCRAPAPNGQIPDSPCLRVPGTTFLRRCELDDAVCFIQSGEGISCVPRVAR